jgi:hypothetical protein
MFKSWSQGGLPPHRRSSSSCPKAPGWSCLCKIATITVLWLSEALLCSAETIGHPVILGLQIAGTQRPLRLETRAGQRLERECVARDVRRLWATGWFDDIQVEVSDGVTPSTLAPLPRLEVRREFNTCSLAPGGGEGGQRSGEGEWAESSGSSIEASGVHVVFKVVEKPHYLLRQIRFHPSRRRYPVEISLGAMIDKRLAHQAAVKLQEKLVDEGYLDAEIRTEIVPVDLRQADLHLRVQPGQPYKVGRVRFFGSLGQNEEELQKVLYQTKDRGTLPGLGNLWKGLQSHPPFSQRGVEANLESLRSFYFSRGYWDSVVQLRSVKFNDNEATVSIAVESGPRYAISSAEISSETTKTETISRFSEDLPTDSLCRCLRKAQRNAEKGGNLDFAVQLDVHPFEKRDSAAKPAQSEQTPGQEPQATLRVRLEPGPSYRVGRIDFQGNHSFGDLTLRRALLLNEGELFDYGKLRGSLSRLNQMGFFETLTQDHVRMVRDPARNQVDLTLELKEKPRGRWALAGSAEPLSLLKPLQFSIGSRLPNWGSRALELSTYVASMSVFPWSEPFAPLFLPAGNRWKPVLAVSRPSLPGQEWRSGFALLPQAGWKGTLFNTSLIQAQRAVSLFGDDSATPPALTVPVWRMARQEEPAAGPRFVGSLLCEAQKPHFTWIKSASLAALDLALSIPKF